MPSNPGLAVSTAAHPKPRARVALVRSSRAGLPIIPGIETEAPKLAARPPTPSPTSPSKSLFTSPISPTSRSAPIPIPSRSAQSAQVQARQSLESSIMFYNFTCAKHEAASRKNWGLQRTAPLRRVVDRMLPEIFDDARNARLEVEEDARGGLYIVADDDGRAPAHGRPASSDSRGAAGEEASTAAQPAGDPVSTSRTARVGEDPAHSGYRTAPPSATVSRRKGTTPSATMRRTRKVPLQQPFKRPPPPPPPIRTPPSAKPTTATAAATATAPSPTTAPATSATPSATRQASALRRPRLRPAPCGGPDWLIG